MPVKRAPIALSELFNKHVHPDHSVVCIGAFANPLTDPSLLQAALITGRGSGKTVVVDSQATKLKRKLEQRRLQGKLSQRQLIALNLFRSLGKFGVGDPKAYRAELRKLKFAGAKLELPQVRIASACETGLASKQFDVLVDAGSLPWIRIGEQLKLWKARKRPFRDGRVPVADVLKEYERIAKKAVFLYGTTGELQNGAQELIDYLVEQKIKFTEHDVENKYEMDLPQNAYPEAPLENGKKILSHYHNYDKALVIEFD